jgi:hypothetical protein
LSSRVETLKSQRHFLNATRHNIDDLPRGSKPSAPRDKLVRPRWKRMPRNRRRSDRRAIDKHLGERRLTALKHHDAHKRRRVPRAWLSSLKLARSRRTLRRA